MLKTIEAVNSAVNNFIWVFQQWSVSLVLDFISVFEQDSFRFESFLTSIKNTLGRIFDKSEAAGFDRSLRFRRYVPHLPEPLEREILPV